MLQLKKVFKHFGSQIVLENINWHLRSSDRVGLCGENGAGKTTLLQLMAGYAELDAGVVQIAKGTTIGYLPQHGLEHSGRDLFSEVRSALSELLAMEGELETLERKITCRADSADLDRYAKLQDVFRHRGGYSIESDIGRILKGLGFSESDWSRPCEQFSGGWQMRIALAKLLLLKPNLLLLDEPTNHLDLPARDWLEEYLASYPHAIVLVSHDRFFLDQVVVQIVEIWSGSLSEYPGNYSQYLSAREERLTILREAKNRQDEEIARIEAFINKFRFNANKAALVQSRIKQLQKIQRIQLPPLRKKIGFSFQTPPKGGRIALTLDNVSHGYNTLTVLEEVNLTVERGERIALVGANGAGKSTLMRLLAGVDHPRAGNREEGHNLIMAYFAQDQAKTLKPDLSVIEQATSAAPFDMVPKIRNLLGAFLFQGDDVHKKTAVLSGGERNRLALAILLLKPANLLLLDEPTNHLDLASKDILLEALQAYQGTLVFVSHDRYFVDALATRIIEIANQRATSYIGNYEDFLRAKNDEGEHSHSSLRVEQSRCCNPLKDSGTKSPEDYAERKAARRERKKQQKELAEIEQKIGSLEQQISKLVTEMQDPVMAVDHTRLAQLADQQSYLQAELDDCMTRWEQLEERIGSGEVE